MPVRKIPKNYRNVTGLAAADKADGAAAFESTLERDYLTLLEFLPGVERFEVQPVTIRWEDREGRLRSYTPDVLVHYRRSAKLPPALVEVKYRSDLKRDWKILRPKLKAGVHYAKLQGWRFEIVSEVEVRTAYLNNVRFLLPFVRRGPASEAHMELLDATLKRLGRTTPTELLSAVFQDEWHRAGLLPSLWYLVGKSVIGADLQAPLTMNSAIWYQR